jgi:hypothetical protein
MTGLGAAPGEQPGAAFPEPDGPELDDQLLDAILAGADLPAAPGAARGVAEALASLAGPAQPGELAGEAAARRAWARARGPAGTPRRAGGAGRLRRSGLLAPAGARLGAAVAVLAVGLGGVTAAAYAAVLPAPVQDLAHHAIGAPPARHSLSRPRPAAQLCTAYVRAAARADATALAAASRQLARAAGGPGRVGAYCAAAGRPGVAPLPPGGSEPPAPEDGGKKTAAPTSGGGRRDGTGTGTGTGGGGDGGGPGNGNGNGHPGGNGDGSKVRSDSKGGSPGGTGSPAGPAAPAGPVMRPGWDGHRELGPQDGAAPRRGPGTSRHPARSACRTRVPGLAVARGGRRAGLSPPGR